MSFTIDGLASGLDTTTIIEGLLKIQQERVDELNSRKTDITQEQSAFKGIEAKLISLRASLGQFSRVNNNVLNNRTATVTHEDMLAVAASSSAAEGVYTVKVNSLAQAHQIASQGMAAEESSITQGTLSLQVGNAAATTITIDDTNDTLQGLADTINASDAGISATIVNDGSATSPYRLMLTSKKMGAASAITVTNNLAATSGDATQPDFTGDAIQDAADASVTLGNGAGAITVTSEKNEIETLISGVTLKLLGADSGQSITVSVQRDTEAAASAINNFVDSYNEVISIIGDLTRYDAATEQAGVLLGNRSATTIQDEIQSAALGVVADLGGSLNRLTALGISVSDSGKLVVNSAKLQDALEGRMEGVDADDVRRLFALDGQSDNGGVRFIGGSTRTQVTSYPVEIDITQAAERATLLAGTALGATTTIDSSNKELLIKIDGKESKTLTLAEGDYTAQELAEHLQATINDDDDLGARNVIVTVEGSNLRITSEVYGYQSEVTMSSGSALSALGFSGGESDKGQDVVGTFTVNGVTETAKGTGRLLMGDPDNEYTADLQVNVSLVSSQVQAGVDANLTLTRGIASKLDIALGDILDPVDGRLKLVSDGFDDQISSLDDSIERINRLTESRRDALILEFAALEGTIAQLQSTSDYLASQLGSTMSLASYS